MEEGTADYLVANTIPAIEVGERIIMVQEKDKFAPTGIFVRKMDCGLVVEGQLNGALREDHQMSDGITYVIQHALPREIQGDCLPCV